MKNLGGHFAPKLGGQFELELGGHFKLEWGGQYHWNLHYLDSQTLKVPIFSMATKIISFSTVGFNCNFILDLDT
jgi:hypothetical protein